MAPLVKELASRPEIQSHLLRHGPAPPNAGRCAGDCLPSRPTMTWTSWSPGRPCPPSPASACWGMERGACTRQSQTWCWSTETPPPPFPARWPPFTSRSQWAMWRPACAPGTSYSPFPEEMNRTLGGRPWRPFISAPPQPTGRTFSRKAFGDGIFVTGQYGDRRPQNHGAEDLSLFTDGPAQHAGLYGRSRSFWSPATGGRTTASPWKTSWLPCAGWRRIFRRWSWSIPSTSSPAVQEAAQRHLSDHERIHLIAAADPPTRCTTSWPGPTLVMTDSGGLQEEAPALGRACPGAAPGDRAA